MNVKKIERVRLDIDNSRRVFERLVRHAAGKGLSNVPPTERGHRPAVVFQ